METRWGVYNEYPVRYTEYSYDFPMPINNAPLFTEGAELRLNWDNVVLLAVF